MPELTELHKLRDQIRELEQAAIKERERLGVPAPGAEILQRYLNAIEDECVYLWGDGWGGAWLVHYVEDLGPQWIPHGCWYFQKELEARTAAETIKPEKEWEPVYEGSAYPKKKPTLEGGASWRVEDCPYGP